MHEESKKFTNTLLATKFKVRFAMTQKHGFLGKYLFRLCAMLLDSCLLSPSLFLERILHRKKIEKLEAPDPVFILGHWRSGTTHLHNLISQDENFTSFTTLDAFLPEASIVWKPFTKILNFLLPESRGIDNVAINMNSPQEEEFGIARMSEFSYYHSFTYPNLDRDLFTRFVTLEEAKPEEIEELEKIYHFLVKKKYYQEKKAYTF